ncbi:MAG: hypothetical protein NC299_06095 [Lachnospiraceae bacterium]|nr:hypothetical protein [Ruminococcus sp.]MCM1274924.1 hypothetical protein [Lachnospiraceae bacterium]
MDLQQAKEFFCGFNGYKFHMFREETGKMMEYDKLNISRKTEDEWRQEVLDKLENRYYTRYNERKDSCWCCYWDFVKVWGNIDTETETEREKNSKRLLEMIGHAALNLDQKQKILIMEGIPSAICLISNTGQKDRLHQAINELVNFDVTFVSDEDGWRDPQARYDKALRHIARSAVEYHIIEKSN